MAMGQQKDRQGDLMVGWAEMPRSPGHVFYDRLQSVLIEGGFDAFAEASCRPYYAARMGAPSVPPGRYFRMHLVGYFEGIDSERGLEWRCSDSLSLREFLRLGSRERVPDHSWLSKTRARLPHEVHAAVFDWVLALIGEAGLVKGERIGVDASTMEANAALRNIMRRDTGEGYREMLEHLARGERHRDAHGRGPGASGPQAQGQEAFQRGLGFEERPRGQDRQDERTARRIWPTSPSTRWIWTPARWWPPSCTRPTRATRRRFPKRWRRPRRTLRALTRRRRQRTRPNV